MDTVENSVSPVGAEGATSSQDTGTQVNTQTDGTSGVVSANEEATRQEDALLAGKYKSPQELEKAYKEAEAKLGSLGQKAKIADLIQQKYNISPEQLQQVIEQQEFEREQQEQARLQQEIEENPGAYAYKELQDLKQQLALQQEEKELNNFLTQRPEFAPFRDKIFSLGLNLERDKTYAEIAEDYFGQAIAHGRQEAYNKIDTKLSTQSTTPTSTPQRQIGVDDYKGMSVAELESVLPRA